MSMELLAPAGSPDALNAAVGEGADAVYLGLKNFNARMRSANFSYSQFEAALRSLRRMGKKLYVAVNTVFEQREADRMYQLLKYLASAGPDALIVQDFGVLAMARSLFPQLKIHASTQMNIASARGCNALSRCGVSRVVLSRELSLEELKALRAQTNMELEIFAHGALCVSASGLCLFSSFLGGKSANRGMCTQACRRLYRSGDNDAGYYFSPADLQLLERLPDIAAAGMSALKIEGRMKSADYVGAVVSAYRLALDAVNGGNEEGIRSAILEGAKILQGDFARGKTAYFFNAGLPGQDGGFDQGGPHCPAFLVSSQDGGTGIALGAIQKAQGPLGGRRALVSGAAGAIPAAGDSIRVHRGDDSERVSHKLRFVEAAGESFWISIPDGFDKGDRVYLIQSGAMSRRHKPVIAPNARAGARGPGHDKAPLPKIAFRAQGGNEKTGGLPDGIYVAVSAVGDLYAAQSLRPARAMLKLGRKNARYLLGENKKPLPFKPADLILVLEPFFTEADSEYFDAVIPRLVERGYRQFVANNLGHFSLFRELRPQVQLTAGPWLYAFNAWALSFVASLGADGFVPPLENNRQNLERTLGPEKKQQPRSLALVPVFAWPPLFRIRADLGHLYDFKTFADSRGEKFFISCDREGSAVYPEKPFSITDKIPFLKEAGFRRFMIDVSARPLKKTDYKDLMRAVENGSPLPRASRFNWKNGFYCADEPAAE